MLNDQFHSVFTKEDHTNFPDKEPSPYPTMKNINISTEGVYKLLKNQSTSHKPTGPDEIPAVIIRAAASQLESILARIYQYTLDHGEIPQD